VDERCERTSGYGWGVGRFVGCDRAKYIERIAHTMQLTGFPVVVSRPRYDRLGEPGGAFVEALWPVLTGYYC
jgi:hypothetical protein